MNFDEIYIWFQCHNVPIAFLRRSILDKIGSQIGVVEEFDEGESGDYVGRFTRVMSVMVGEGTCNKLHVQSQQKAAEQIHFEFALQGSHEGSAL